MSYDSYLGNLIAAFSQFAHALLGGDRDISISARVGYMARWAQSGYWLFIERVIDTTYYPLEGPGHCWRAYRRDTRELYKFRKGNVVFFTLLTMLVLVACLVFSVISWGLVYPVRKLTTTL